MLRPSEIHYLKGRQMELIEDALRVFVHRFSEQELTFLGGLATVTLDRRETEEIFGRELADLLFERATSRYVRLGELLAGRSNPL